MPGHIIWKINHNAINTFSSTSLQMHHNTLCTCSWTYQLLWHCPSFLEEGYPIQYLKHLVIQHFNPFNLNISYLISLLIVHIHNDIHTMVCLLHILLCLLYQCILYFEKQLWALQKISRTTLILWMPEWWWVWWKPMG